MNQNILFNNFQIQTDKCIKQKISILKNEKELVRKISFFLFSFCSKLDLEFDCKISEINHYKFYLDGNEIDFHIIPGNISYFLNLNNKDKFKLVNRKLNHENILLELLQAIYQLFPLKNEKSKIEEFFSSYVIKGNKYLFQEYFGLSKTRTNSLFSANVNLSEKIRSILKQKVLYTLYYS